MIQSQKKLGDNKIEGVTVYHDILYVADSQHEKHFLDVYVPSKINDTHEKAPVVFFVHGGGWKRGDRKWDNWPTRSRLYKNVGYACAKKGYVCVVISYRLSNLGKRKHTFLVFMLTCILSTICLAFFQLFSYLVGFSPSLFFGTPFAGFLMFFVLFMALFAFIYKNFFKEGEEVIKHPDHIEDCCKAYKWTCDHIDNYHGDSSQIFLMGHSAGAHLVTLMSLDTSYLKNASATLENIKGVIGISGVYNFERLKQTSFGIGHFFFIEPLMHTDHDQSFFVDISPLTHARSTPFPFLLLNAGFDFHLQTDALELSDSLTKLGVNVEHHENIHTHHGSIIQCIGSKKDVVTPLICDWIKKKTDEENKENKNDENQEKKQKRKSDKSNKSVNMNSSSLLLGKKYEKAEL
jgi:acetyl esterase/lipase